MQSSQEKIMVYECFDKILGKNLAQDLLKIEAIKLQPNDVLVTIQEEISCIITISTDIFMHFIYLCPYTCEFHTYKL